MRCLLVCLLALGFLPGALYALQIDDAFGEPVVLHAPAKRILALAPDITEILYDIGAGDRIIGTVDTSDYPEGAKLITRIGNHQGLDLEKIMLLKPDLVVVWGRLFAQQLQLLQRLHIPVYHTNPKKLQDVAHLMRALGVLTGLTTQAEKRADVFLQALADCQKRQKVSGVKVFYQLGSYSLLTVNRESWISEAIELCGGYNLFSSAKTITPEISWEGVVLANPEVIISDATNPNWTKRWQAWPSIAAVRKKQFYTIDPSLIGRAGPRLVEGVSKICAFLNTQKQPMPQPSPPPVA